MTSVDPLPAKWWTTWNNQDPNDVFGPFRGAHSVQEALYNTLQKWLPTYIAEMNRSLGGDILYPPISYRLPPDMRRLPRNTAPSIQVIADGTSAPPIRTNSAISSRWKTRVTAFVAGTKSWEESQAIAFAHAACIRACCVQHPALESTFVSSCLWRGERFSSRTDTVGRWVYLVEVDFNVAINVSMNPFGGIPGAPYAATGVPSGPNLLPPPSAPEVETVDISISQEEDSG